MSDNSTLTEDIWELDNNGKVIVTIIFGSIILVGVVGNALVIGLIVRVRKLHTTVNLCLGCLAVADLMVLVLVPIQSWHILYDVDDSALGLHFCIFLNSINRAGMVCPTLIFLLVGVERYAVLCHPLKSIGRWTRKKVSLLLVIILLITVGVSIPFGFATTYEQEILDDNTTVIYCDTDWELAWVESYETAVIGVFFFLPIPVLILLYGKMIIALKKRIPQSDNQGAGARGTSQSRSKVVKMLVVVIGVFVICLLPFNVYIFVDIYAADATTSLDEKSYVIINWSARIVAYINNASNPVIYFLMSDNFRNGFQDVFCKRRKTMNRTLSVPTISSSL